VLTRCNAARWSMSRQAGASPAIGATRFRAGRSSVIRALSLSRCAKKRSRRDVPRLKSLLAPSPADEMICSPVSPRIQGLLPHPALPEVRVLSKCPTTPASSIAGRGPFPNRLDRGWAAVTHFLGWSGASGRQAERLSDASEGERSPGKLQELGLELERGDTWCRRPGKMGTK
jgi:hypothetical protein